MFLLVLPLVDFAIFVVAPDVRACGLPAALFRGAGRAGWRQSTSGLLRIGVLGGIAYWTKAYALPFVLLHLPMTMLLLPDGGNFSRRCRSAAVALLGFAIPVSLWVAAMTWQNGSITIGSSGAINHAVVGPPDVVRYHPVVFGIPTPPHVSVWETPEKLPYQYWSPLQSWPYFRQHQMRIVGKNVGSMSRVLANFDPLNLSAVMFVLLIPLGWWLRRDDAHAHAALVDGGHIAPLSRRLFHGCV